MRAAPLAPGQIQPPDDPIRALAERNEMPLAIALKGAFQAAVARLDLAALAALIARNDFAALFAALQGDLLRAALRPALNRLARIHDSAAIETTLSIADRALGKAGPSKLKTPAVIHLSYDPLAPRTVADQQRQQAALSTRIEAALGQSAARVLSDGLNARLKPAQIARNLRDSLILTEQEATAIANYRRSVESGSMRVLDRSLRDRRFDRSAGRSDLTEDKIDRIVARYAERYRAYRALRIAKTESLRAANQGARAAWQQYAERLRADARDIRRFWLTAGDELVCAICRPIPALNPAGRGLDEPYETPIGTIDAPPDPHPLCRCTERFEQVQM